MEYMQPPIECSYNMPRTAIQKKWKMKTEKWKKKLKLQSESVKRNIFYQIYIQKCNARRAKCINHSKKINETNVLNNFLNLLITKDSTLKKNPQNKKIWPEKKRKDPDFDKKTSKKMEYTKVQPPNFSLFSLLSVISSNFPSPFLFFCF